MHNIEKKVSHLETISKFISNFSFNSLFKFLQENFKKKIKIHKKSIKGIEKDHESLE